MINNSNEPSKHPEQHPWERIGSTAYWCPLCGATMKTWNGPVALPEIAKEPEYLKISKGGG